MILVKANSYGHGAVQFASFMEQAGADYFAVATPNEGIELRQGGIKLPILVLSPGSEYYKEMMEYNIEPAMQSVEAMERFAAEMKLAGVSEFPVHINIDTGMHRLGFMENEIEDLKNFLKSHPQVKLKSLYTHLAASDEYQYDEFTLGQINLFTKLADEVCSVLDYTPLRHVLNSAGIERFTEYQMDMVRLGIGIYGISAIGSKDLQQTAFYCSPIIQIKELSAENGTVGYGRNGKLGPEVRKIATICVGYADGINRHLGNGRAAFEVRGKLAPTIGNICMDMCMLDVSDIDGVEVGDTVTIFGDNPSASDIAKILDTIPYEIFTSVSHRVKREVVD